MRSTTAVHGISYPLPHHVYDRCCKHRTHKVKGDFYSYSTSCCIFWEVGRCRVHQSTNNRSTVNKMARQSDKEGERAEGKHQRYRRPTRPLCCRRHGDRRRRDFSSSPVEIVFPFTLLSALFFLCFFVSNTSSFTTGPTYCTANLGMKNAFPITPGVFTRSPRQWWQEGTGGSSLSLSAVPSRSFKDDGQKLEGAEGFAGRKAELEPAGWAGSVVLLLQEALFSARRRASLLSRWSSSSSSLSVRSPPPPLYQERGYLCVCEQR